MSTTAVTPEIRKAEEEAQTRVERARTQAQEDMSSFQREQEKHVQEKKEEIKAQTSAELRTQKESLGTTLKKGVEDTEKKKKQLQDTYAQHKDAVVPKLVDQFLRIAT